MRTLKASPQPRDTVDHPLNLVDLGTTCSVHQRENSVPRQTPIMYCAAERAQGAGFLVVTARNKQRAYSDADGSV
jgi:hypothetical protein